MDIQRVDTTFWLDFSIADRLGKAAVKDTYRTAFESWKDNYKYLTELVMVLNHKIWEHHEAGNNSFAELYDSLWRKADLYAMENLRGEELRFFCTVTD